MRQPSSALLPLFSGQSTACIDFLLPQVLHHGLGLPDSWQAGLGGKQPSPRLGSLAGWLGLPACALRHATSSPTPPHPTCPASCQRTPDTTPLQTQEAWSFAIPALWLTLFATPAQLARARELPNALCLAAFLLHCRSRRLVLSLAAAHTLAR